MCQVFSFTVPEKPKSWTELARAFGFFNIHSVAKSQQIEEGPFEDNKIFGKNVSQSRNKAQTCI